ncbi:putative serine peptidase, Clan S-, family S54 [Trypanosoma conorhini]|uniref:Putative serine peptidase, Clan S-, family S54 n=1 Tax=Trypanosoma conorhini TaxID=83891 RepID=A0A422PFW7_9TRYP|nr:putative serine peptidase, Clan S-, family S54 [Trypanosoma conorhini]RNF16614.1 putative serine peptidase, Clan S-, family S54 [Trypanosoma conorhini]
MSHAVCLAALQREGHHGPSACVCVCAIVRFLLARLFLSFLISFFFASLLLSSAVRVGACRLHAEQSAWVIVVVFGGGGGGVRMVHVELTCAAIRLTPVWVCLLAYYQNGEWPTQLQALVRVMDYGFSVDAFKRRPIVLLTHLFVHANDSHLLGNLSALTATLVEFGGPSVVENVEEESAWVSLRRTLGSFVVLVGGGIVGGIGGQLLYNDAQLARRHRRWLSLAGVQEGAGGGAVDGVLRRVRNWVDRMNYKIDKRRTDAVFMCGASAGICSLAGFNAAYYQRWGTALAMVVPEFVAVVCSLLRPQAELASAAWLPAGEVVGHAAHIGGFTVGVCMGLAWRWLSGVYRSRTKRRQKPKNL